METITSLKSSLNFFSSFYTNCKMSFNYFEATSHVATYNKFRPDPPKSLIKKIVEYTSKTFPEPLELAVDVGCGSGQSTEVLAPYFKKVLGIDPSDKIIQEAKKKCKKSNVFYSAFAAEELNLDSKCANLITTCQALHWFDIPKFYSEAERVLLPKGTFAVYGYNLPIPVYQDNKEIEKIVEKYYKDVLGPYTLPQSRKVYLESYTSKEFNEVYFVEGEKMQREGSFILETEGSVDDIIGYISSWSAFQNYTKQTSEESGKKILESFKEQFKDILKCEDDHVTDKLKIRFNYFLLLGRKK